MLRAVMIHRDSNTLYMYFLYHLCDFLFIRCISFPLIYSFCSFFVVEDHILHTTQGLVNRAYVEELWELALSKTIAALRTHSVCLCSSLQVLYNGVSFPG